jgi:hypothetical protein
VRSVKVEEDSDDVPEEDHEEGKRTSCGKSADHSEEEVDLIFGVSILEKGKHGADLDWWDGGLLLVFEERLLDLVRRLLVHENVKFSQI